MDQLREAGLVDDAAYMLASTEMSLMRPTEHKTRPRGAVGDVPSLPELWSFVGRQLTKNPVVTEDMIEAATRFRHCPGGEAFYRLMYDLRRGLNQIKNHDEKQQLIKNAFNGRRPGLRT
jgi:hypothetical protein